VSNVILDLRPLGFPWATLDPFLFCVHHDDAYPEGNEELGPKASLAGRRLGQDFDPNAKFRMYHGDVVPGFPQHPHRGFETVTIVRRGFVDHSDSLGATARFGSGDAQWLTAGGGICHSEMFPLLERDKPNPLELFQIWLNLPAADKLVQPHFAMLWKEEIPERNVRDSAGKNSSITLVAGELDGVRPPAPPPHSWAARTDSEVAIWCIRMEAGARLTLPKALLPGVIRTLYFFEGASLEVSGERVEEHAGIVVQSDRGIELTAGDEVTEILLLQGRPIEEPVVQHGPFVMNSRAEVQRAMDDYQRTRFGGWPWPKDAPVHPRDAGRFAKHADGKIESFPR
jgi:redox-sensitive bicupin YhaK (pirin superfamily)